MYNGSQMNGYPFYPNTNGLTRSHEENTQKVSETILAAIKREASTVELYKQLANAAPNETHKSGILYALERKKSNLIQFTNLYISFTGTQPTFEVELRPFQSYQEGLQIAYETEVEGYKEDQQRYLLTQHPQVRNVLLWALAGEQENAARFEFLNGEALNQITDYGTKPFVVNIEQVTKQNNTFRTALWTGTHLQVTLMSINVGEDIGLEVHPTLDQFLRLEQGQGIVQMGADKDRLDFQRRVADDFVILIPAGTWHNLTNTGNIPLKLYSIYAPPEHPFGTVHETKAIAMAAEEEHHHHE
ncbi:cupin domain-containing protein [Bacillus sp. B15-48]|uniref:cupin domain-containing protein n=1 Tax=Bacillus sp. B15-48 TaxID=1548601 RepID=UPI0031B879DC